MNFITQFLCSCAGCDIATLKQCNSAEQRKMAIIGSCVLITPILGVASGTFAMLTFSNNLPLSIGFGLLWGFVIFLIERAVVSNTRPGEINMGVLSRIFLACIFAVVIAIPMELKVFEDAIQEKLDKNISNEVKGIKTDYAGQIRDINYKLDAEKSKVDALRQSYIGEVDGTTGSKVAYRGPIAKEKERLWNQESKVYNQKAVSAQNQINAKIKERDEKIESTKESQARGFLGRMRALGELSEQDKTVFWGIWLLRLFFLAIELIPIFTKLSSGRKGNAYYQITEQNGEMAVKVNAQMEEVRAEEMIKQQRALVNKELLELQFSEEKEIMNDAQKRFDFYMGQLKKASDRKLIAQQHIFSTVKEESIRNHLMEQIEKIYDDFQRILTELANRKQGGSNYINNLN